MLPRPRGVSLRQLLPGAQFLGTDDLRVTSCAGDSRLCQPGDLFVALRGTRHDGHDHISEAITRGAAAIVAEQSLANAHVPGCLVPDSREAYGRICQALVGDPSRQLKVIGITGTNGKTTTSWLVASILAAAGIRCGVIGTLGSYDGFEIEPVPLTTPAAAELARQLARHESAGCTHVAIEVSSHALDQRRLAGVQLDVAAVTQIERDHLDYHGTLENYRAAKQRIFDLLPCEGMGVVNVDDEMAAGLLDQFHGPALSVGIDSPCEISATPLEQFISEQTFLLSAGDESVPVRTPLVGRHNIYNCLVAAAIASIYDVDLPTIARGIESVRYIPGRLERIECGQPFSVFVDYAHTPGALASCLASLRPLTSGRLICVFGAGGERDRQKRPLMASAVERWADMAVVTSDNPRNESPQDIADQLIAGFRQPRKVRSILDRLDAIEWALAQAEPGDCVLLAGKGHEEYQQIGDERIRFDDREAARQWLYQHADERRFFRASA